MGSSFKKIVGDVASDVEAVKVEFSAWLPDQMNAFNPGGCEALNVIPGEGGYVPFKDLTLLTTTLGGACRGAATINSLSRSIKLFAATASEIKVRVGTGWSSLYTFANAISDFNYVHFIPFGTYMVIIHPETPTLLGNSNTDEVKVLAPEGGGKVPRARCGSRVGDFMVLGNLDDEYQDATQPRQPRRIRWNGFNSVTQPWVSNEGVQSDFQDLPGEGGEVMAICGREFGTIFQERMITRMTYMGPPTIFSFETVEEERGSICTDGVIDTGSLIYFIAQDGFFVWNGINTSPIGDEQVNKWFFDNLNYAERNRIVGAWDPATQSVRWAFPIGTGTALTDQIIFSYKEKRWSHAQNNVEYLLNGLGLPASLDDLTGNLDTDYAISFDNGIYGSGRQSVAGFSTAHCYGIFTGSALAATLETSEASAPSGERLFINSARPLVDVSTAVATMQVASRDQLLAAALTYGAVVNQEVTGECPVIADARYARFRVNLPAGASWSHALGVEVWRKALGRS